MGSTPQPPPAPTVGSQLQGANTPLGGVSFKPNATGGFDANVTAGQGAQNAINAFNSESPIDIKNAAVQGGQLAQNFMAPNFQQQQSALQSQLQNQGFSVSDPAYQLAERNLGTAQNQY